MLNHRFFSMKIMCASLLIMFIIPALSADGFSQGKNMKSESTDFKADENISSETTAIPTIAEENYTEQNDNLFATVKQGGPLMIVLIILGIISMTIVIERLIFFTRNRVWKIESMDEVLFDKAKYSGARFREDLEDDVRGEFQIYANSLERGLPLLSGIGNISPIVGFLGTVIGMISAFAAIAAATTVNAKVVAVGIQVALVTTAGGLLVAAPTLVFFYLFTHVIQNRYSRAEEIINGLCENKPRLSDRICEEEPLE